MLPDGTFRFRTVVLLVGRQNGKSTLLMVLVLWRMFVEAAPLTIGTAQNLDVSEELWADTLELVRDVPDLSVEVPPRNVKTGNSKKVFWLRSGERYKVATASRKGGRGLSGDLVLMDELREHTTFASWSAVSKTTLARLRAQVWGVSNAGDALSVVLRRLRALAHQALGWPDGDDDAPTLGVVHLQLDAEQAAELERDGDSLGIFEYSAPPGVDIFDRQWWPWANPSLGYPRADGSGLTERAIAAAARTDPEDVFRTEVLCQWVTGAGHGPFPKGRWLDRLDPDSGLGRKAKVWACVDVSHDRSMTYIAFGGWRKDGTRHGEVVAQRAGTDWVVDWLTGTRRRRDRIVAVAVAGTGAPVVSLLPALHESGLTVIEMSITDQAAACGIAFDLVDGGGVARVAQPVLDVAATTAAVKPVRDAWVIDRARSPADAAPLIAWIGALWCMDKAELDQDSVYEDNDLMVV